MAMLFLELLGCQKYLNFRHKEDNLDCQPLKTISLFNHIWQNDDIEVIQHLKGVDKTKINIKPKNENYEKEPGEGMRLDRCETFDASLKSKEFFKRVGL